MTRPEDRKRTPLDSTASLGDAAPDPGQPMEGHIGRYVVRRALGSGGIGVVVAAHDPELNREVAIKIVADERPDSRTRLVRDAQAMERL